MSEEKHYPAMGRGFEPGDEPETPEEAERLDRALEDLTWEGRQQVEADVAMGDYGTPMDKVLAELDDEEGKR